MPLNLGPLGDAENRFRQGYGDFARGWAVVRENWLDDQCERFERQRLSSLGPALTRLTASLQALESVARKADRELSDPDHSVSGLS